ncbi:MAG: flagellar biosynthesis protein FliQ [Bacillota bacterium]|jgi:flagellar biosynthetic protein FliQ|nr:flagellar biosynthesis protein FliQ [Bacillota bacterium]HOB92064.1 flagellar biosynthesis protein FliQ [Bacillota bacterium]HPZ54371.1 flagellar biosynthesis protein FliQ [Bacillota bacterium]HQD18554.1 flagellar biosynthesis protein FliQ [Bacillota bacterium]
MSQTLVIELGRATLLLAVKLAAPMLGFGLLVGLLVSIFQAATQIQEMTLTFIPKILAVFVALAVFGPWMLQNLVSFAASIFSNLGRFAQ